MENFLRSALITHLASDPVLDVSLNSVTEELPIRTASPWLAIAASASRDWSTKDKKGREIRVAFELHTRGETSEETATLTNLVEEQIDAFPAEQQGFCVASNQFLRARVEQRENLTRAVLLEYRFRLLEI